MKVIKKAVLVAVAVILLCCFSSVLLRESSPVSVTPAATQPESVPTTAVAIELPTPTKAPTPSATVTVVLVTPTRVPPSMWRCPDSTEGAEYVASEKSNKFHELNCRYVKKIKPENRICFAHRDAAVAFDYIPCKFCKP